MKSFKETTSIANIVLLLVGFLFTQISSADELKVIATIKPVHSILAGLMAGIEQPQLLIQQSPHNFKPDSSVKTQLDQSDLVVWVGPELEKSLQSSIEGLPADVRVIELLSNPNLKILSKRYNDNRRDPYFWLDTRNVLILVDELALILIDVDPIRTHLYKKNRRNVRRLLRKLDRELEYGYRGLQGGVGYLYHDTQQYFEQAYALKTGGELLDNPDSIVDATKLLKVRSQLANGDFNCLLTEREMSDSHLNLLVPGNSSQVWQLDSLGLQFEAGADLYIKMMQYNSSVIKQCLKVNEDGLKRIDSVAVGDGGGISKDGRFIMINHLGEVVTERDMLGKYQLLFFGYISCPDVCPLSLHTLTAAIDELGDDAKQFQAYFITVDPERDDVITMHRYVDYFENKIIGLTGQQPMLKQMAKQYRVKYKRVYDADPKNRGNYQMDHTAGLFVVAPDGEFITKLAHGISSSSMANALRVIVK